MSIKIWKEPMLWINICSCGRAVQLIEVPIIESLLYTLYFDKEAPNVTLS